MTELRLQDENFTGVIPVSIGNLSKLNIVSISDNNISNIDNLTTLPLLEELLAYNIGLTGSLPNFGSQAHLNILDLSENPSVSQSTIPQWIQNLNQLTALYLNNVGLIGDVPIWLNEMNSLTTLQLGENHLEGGLPDWIFENGWQDVRLGYNNFYGDLPSIPQNTTLRFVDLSHNQISGSLPSTIENLQKLNVFDLSHNQLSGALPADIGTFTPNFGSTYIYLNNNGITSIPSAFWDNFVSPATTIILDNNGITDVGIVPSNLTSNGHISLRENFLSYKDLELAFAYSSSGLLSSFSPQRSESTISVREGQPLQIEFELPATSVVVQWEKLESGAWQDISGLDESTALNIFRRNAASLTDAGTYRYKVSNAQSGGVPSVLTEPLEVTVEEVTQTSVINDYAFQYKYDGRRRMTHKKVPGADWVYLVYDNRDRLVMTQDGNQRNKQPNEPREWTFTKYDELNRPVLTGIYKDTENLDQDLMQRDIDEFYVAANNNIDEWFEASGSVVHGYTNQSFPKVDVESDYLTVTYYDDYAFQPLIGSTADDYNYDENQLTASGNEPGQRPEEFTRVKGQVTGSKIKNLDTNEFLWSVNYYDDRYRVIQVIAQNNKGGLDKITSVFDFVGKVLRTKTDHNSNGSKPIAIATIRKLSYDHVGRLEQIEHQIDTADAVILVKNEYNELGQMVTKGLHSEDDITYKQQVDYRYNIRGWLTRINDSNLSAADGGPKDYFGMELGYNLPLGIIAQPSGPGPQPGDPGGDPDAVGTAEPQYNGNISAIKWSTNLGFGFNDTELGILEPTARAYGFEYDPMNRLKAARHYENTTGWNPSSSFHEYIDKYDLNGNIDTLKRTGKGGNTMDILGYTYSGNQLMKVVDNGNDQEGFKDGNVTGKDYIYDDSGNMVTDKNKNIATIEYNHLNLPAKVTKTTGEYIKYVYNAAGVKLSQIVYDSSNAPQKKTDYLGEFFYENDTLKFVNHEEGRIVMTDTVPEYQYTLKDHLGNIRITFTERHEVETFTATMEDQNRVDEQKDFGAYQFTTNDLLDHTDSGAQYDKVLVLNGGYDGQVGLTKSFAVVPGDKVSATVYAKYVGTTGPPGNPGALHNFAVALTEAFSLSPTPPGEGTTAFDALDAFGTWIASGERDDEDEDPKGFLNILVFDKEYNLVDVAYEQIDATFVQSGAEKAPHDTLASEVEVRQPGYVYFFLSNEGNTQQQIGFDDLVVIHEHSDVIQQDDYYPFGLTFNSYQRENSVENKFKFQGQEHIDDLDLGWDSFKWRNHQPDIGRFFNIDPLSDKYVYNSPYAFSENHVVAHTELEGLEKVSIQQSLNNNYAFYRAYNIERQTSGGKTFERLVSNQTKYNVLYYVFTYGATGYTAPIRSIGDFRRAKQGGYFSELNEKEVEQAMGDKQLILIGVDDTSLAKDDNGFDAATSLNHEEYGHGRDLLDDENIQSMEEDHDFYYGEYRTDSPNDSDVMTNPKYSNTRAKKQFDEIYRIIIRQVEKQQRQRERAEEQEEEKTKNEK